MKRAVMVSLGLLLGTPSSAAPALPPTQPRNIVLPSSARISGNHVITEAELRAAMAKSQTLDEASAAIEAAYFAKGYVEARVTKQVALDHEPPLLTIVEGKRFTLGTITVVEVGDHAKKDELSDPRRLGGVVTIRAGEPFEKQRVTAFMQVLRDRYDAAGFGTADVTPVSKVDPEAGTVGLRFEIDRGRVRKISAIEVSGTAQDTLVRRLLLAKVGDIYSSRKQREAEKRLGADGAFRGVGIEAFDDPAGIRLVVTVEEKAAK